MPLPQPLQSQILTSRFWSNYFFETEPEDREDDGESEVVDYSTTFPVSSEYALSLNFTNEFLGIELGFHHPRGFAELGWDDQAHWHPHVLRWQELDLIGRATALLDPTLMHPGIPLLLLQRFAPICVGDDVNVIHALMESAWRELKIFGNDDEIRDKLERFDCRQAEFTWTFAAPHGWTIDQPETARSKSQRGLYTTRCAENTQFPFDHWSALISAAQQTCAHAVKPEWLDGSGGKARALAMELAASRTVDPTQAALLADMLHANGCRLAAVLNGLRAAHTEEAAVQASWILELLLDREPGVIIKHHSDKTKFNQRIVYSLNLTVEASRANAVAKTLKMPDGKIVSLPLIGDYTVVRKFRETLDKKLRAEHLGSAHAQSSSMSSAGSEPAKVTIGVQVKGDLERGIELIRATYREIGSPSGSTLELMKPERRKIAWS